MPPTRPLPYWPDRPSIVIVKRGAATHVRGGNRLELTWVRYITDDGDVCDVMRQQRWHPIGRRIDGELPIEFGVTAAAMFDRYVVLDRQIAEDAGGLPALRSVAPSGCRMSATTPRLAGSAARSEMV
jgi:hypothetical protein